MQRAAGLLGYVLLLASCADAVTIRGGITVDKRIRTIAALEATKLQGLNQVECSKDASTCKGGYLSMWAWIRHLELDLTNAVKIVAADELSSLVTYYPGRWAINKLVWERMGVDFGVMTTSNIITAHYKTEVTGFLRSCLPQTPVVSANMDESAFFYLEGYTVKYFTKTVDNVTIGYIPLWGDQHYISTLSYPVVMPTLTARLREIEKVDLIMVLCLGYDVLYKNATDLAQYDVDAVFLPAKNALTEPTTVSGTVLLPRPYPNINDRLNYLHYIDAIRVTPTSPWTFTAYASSLEYLPISTETPEFQAEYDWFEVELAKAASNNATFAVSVYDSGRRVPEYCSRAECLVGNLITDACLDSFESKDIDIMVINGGAFKTEYGWDAGADIGRSDIEGVFPYLNTLCTFTTPGTGLFQMIEHGLTSHKSDINQVVWGGFLQVSRNTEIEYNEDLPMGQRVVSISINGVPITRQKLYTVGSLQYICEGGDQYDDVEGFTMGDLTFLPQDVGTAIADYLSNHDPYDSVALQQNTTRRLFPVNSTNSLNLVALSAENCTDYQRWVYGWNDCEQCPPGTWHPEPGTSPCIDRASSHGVQLSIILAVLFSGLVVLGLIGYYFLTKKQRHINKLYSANKVAEDCSTAIASMRLEELDYLTEIEHPNSLQRSFLKIVTMLKDYRSYLPLAVVNGARCQDDDVMSLHGDDVLPSTPQTEGSEGKDNFDPMVLQNLQQGLRKKPVTILVVNVINFRSFFSESPERIIHVHAEYVRYVLQSIQGRGVAEPFSGDRITITWNCNIINPMHKESSCETGLALIKNKAPENMELSVGISSTAAALCGNIGTEGMKKFCILGPCYMSAHVLQMLNKFYDTKILVDNRVAVGLGNRFLFKMHDRLRYTKYEVMLEAWELLDITKNIEALEWMYEVAYSERIDPNKVYNEAWKAFLGNQSEQAKSLLRRCQDQESVSYHRLADLVHDTADGINYYGIDPPLLECI